jgi:hypothetical protein
VFEYSEPLVDNIRALYNITEVFRHAIFCIYVHNILRAYTLYVHRVITVLLPAANNSSRSSAAVAVVVVDVYTLYTHRSVFMRLAIFIMAVLGGINLNRKGVGDYVCV